MYVHSDVVRGNYVGYVFRGRCPLKTYPTTYS
jgi:hypothetical protein